VIGMNFDPEVPAGFQDADIEMLELAEAANNAAHEEAFRGRCWDCNGRGVHLNFDQFGNRQRPDVCRSCDGAGELF